MKRIPIEHVRLERNTLGHGASARVVKGVLTCCYTAEDKNDTGGSSSSNSQENVAKSGQAVVVKIVDVNDRNEELKAEYNAYTKLHEGRGEQGSHHVRAVHGIIDDEEKNKFVMEKMDTSLYDILDTGGDLQVQKWFPTASTSISLLLDIVQGLIELHSVGIVHCDLRPSNVLLLRHRSTLSSSSSVNDGIHFTAKVADLGTSDPIDTPFQSAYVNRRKKLVHLTSDRHATSALDVHGLGVMMMEIMCGRAFQTQGDLNTARRSLRADLVHYATQHAQLKQEDIDTEAIEVDYPSCMYVFKKRSRGTSWTRPAFANDILAMKELLELAEKCVDVDPSKRPSAETVRDGLLFAALLTWY